MKRLLGLFAVLVIALAASAQWSVYPDDIPAYNAAPPTRPLPPVLHGAQLTGPYFSHPYQVIAYKMAARIPNVLHQEPCYCRCDRGFGHNSLHSCFEGTHGAACDTCMKEIVYTYQQTRLGRTPAQIRTHIEHGDWNSVNLDQAAL